MFFSFEKVLSEIKNDLHSPSDFASRTLLLTDQEICLIFLKSMVDEPLISQSIIKPITESKIRVELNNVEQTITSAQVKKVEKNEVVQKLLNGNVILIFQNGFVAIDIQKFVQRVPAEPPTSPVIKGPRQGFTEDLKTNISLLRRRFYSSDLCLKQVEVGKLTKTKIMISYLDSVADKSIVKKVEKRLSEIEIDGVVDSYYILEFLQERPKSFFKQLGQSEKPDVVASKLLEGRIAIIVDGSPIVLTLPYIAIEGLQSSNDYYTNPYFSTFIRYVRMIGLILAVIVPGAYLALRLFHYNVIPTKFLITIADTTQSIPFTPFIELLFISLLFQILYEVSLRLPSYLGLATSIVGALILGETGVNAGLISPPGVIVVALSKIAAYTFPDEASEITVLQLIFLILGGSMGFLGIVGGVIYFINYLNQIDSYGAPYLAPYSPRISSDLKDALTKMPLTSMVNRPKSFKNVNERRQSGK